MYHGNRFGPGQPDYTIAPHAAPIPLGTRRAKVFHQVDQVVAQSRVRRHGVDRFYACYFDLWQHSFGCRDRRRLLGMCSKRPRRSDASEQAHELAPLHQSAELQTHLNALKLSGRAMVVENVSIDDLRSEVPVTGTRVSSVQRPLVPATVSTSDVIYPAARM